MVLSLALDLETTGCLSPGVRTRRVVSGYILDHPELVVALTDTEAKNWPGTSITREQWLACVRVLWGHHAPISALCVSSELDVVVSGATDR